MEFYNQSLQLLVKGMRRRGLDFSITETNYTTTLICGKQSYKFVSKPMNKPTFLVSQMLYSAVKKSNILGKIKPQESKYFQTYHHIKDIFDQEVLKSNIPVVIDVFATWCGPCQQVAPLFDELAKELEGKYKLVKINIDEERDLAIKYNVSSIPTFIFIKGGEVVGKETG